MCAFDGHRVVSREAVILDAASEARAERSAARLQDA